MDSSDFGGNERAKDLNRSEIDGTTFFDENERHHDGSHVDEATGERYNNDDDMDSQSPEMKTVAETTFSNKDLNNPEDPAIQLLREQFKNDPEALREMGLL
jgi:hypothetical protein